jgi:hypothetical protein
VLPFISEESGHEQKEGMTQMEAENTQCGYPGCPNPGERRVITEISGVGKVDLSVDMCNAHFDLRDLDDDVIGWLKEEWLKQTDN